MNMISAYVCIITKMLIARRIGSYTDQPPVVDVNDVLYRLSHATVYINYDGYATYSMTFKPKAKSG